MSINIGRPITRVESLNDPRIADYRDLKDRELAARGERFIAEGEFVVRRLLASGIHCESVLLAQRRAAEIGPLVPPSVELFVSPDQLLHHIIGFRFHSGVIAVGRRPAPASVEQIVANLAARATLVVLPEINSTENMGSLLRICGGFGVDAVVLGERCCDPFYRQSVRVSMGTIFKLKLARSADLPADLRRLGEAGVESVASVLDESAEPLAAACRADRMAILFGNEAQGLPPEIVAACGRRVTIPMRLGTDSLNVAVAAGVFLYHFS